MSTYFIDLLMWYNKIRRLKKTFFQEKFSEEANWTGSALFVIAYVHLNQILGSSNLIGWK